MADCDRSIGAARGACGDDASETTTDPASDGGSEAAGDAGSTIAGIDAAMWADDVGSSVDGDTVIITGDGSPIMRWRISTRCPGIRSTSVPTAP